MRVLHVNKFLYRRGGAEGYMEDVAALQRSRGHVTGFWGMDHPENTHLELADTFPSEVDLEPVPAGLRPRLAAAGRMVWSTSAKRGLAAAVERFRPDVVHLHNIYHQLSPSILRALRSMGVPSVMTLHDYKLVCPSYQMLAGGQVCDACIGGHVTQAVRRRCKDGSLTSSALLAFESGVHRAMGAYDPVGVFICPSRFLFEQVARGGVDAGRLRVVRHFVDPATVAPKVQPGGDVLVAGRISHEKGIDTAIRAAAALPDGRRLHVAGEGPALPALRTLADEVAPGRVVFHGRLGRAELHDLLRSCAVAAVPSRWNENQPMAVLEALGCAVPVVATDLGGLPELVRPGVDGELVPADDHVALGDALAKLTDDPGLAFEMGRAGRARILDEFSPELHLEQLATTYAEAGAGA